MGAQHYGADSENGDRIEDPSEDALFMMISDLDDTRSSAVTPPATPALRWSREVLPYRRQAVWRERGCRPASGRHGRAAAPTAGGPKEWPAPWPGDPSTHHAVTWRKSGTR